MRVAILAEVFLPKIDGVVHRTLNLIRELRKAGDEVMVVCPQAEGCKNCAVPVHEFGSFSFPLYPEYRIGLPDQRLVEVVEEFVPDVLHFINPFAFGFRCHDVLRRAGVQKPTVFSFHTLYGEFVKKYPLLKPLSRFLWWLTRVYHNQANTNITVSRPMQEELVQRGFHSVRYWPPAVDGNLFSPAARNTEMRARLAGPHTDKKVLLTVSRLAPEKNVAFLADVLAQVPNTCLAIVGDGPHRSALERRFAGLNANFIGYLKGESLAAAYASSDAFVYASETETMGNVVLEAMACGCPVMAPRAGGIPSLVEHGKTGLLYSPGSRDEATQHVRRLLDNDDLHSHLREAARECVATWDWTHSIAEVRGIYRETISEYEFITAKTTWPQRIAQASMNALISGFRLMSPA